MITISLCMIVKNEEAVLNRCLDTVADLVDEIVIVDTGSTDATKTIAARYTDKIYDFQWIDDFSAARNFAFSKATQEYIYTADADEVINEENREKFRLLKEQLLPEIEIVQMKYGNQLSFGTVYNFDEEYRPKLFKRLREFVWEEAIHETIRTFPIVYDSDIVITHLPTSPHGGRDLKNFKRQISEGKILSKRLSNMYARELLLGGSEQDVADAEWYFEQISRNCDIHPDTVMEAYCVLVRAARLNKDVRKLMKYAMKAVLTQECSEVCLELGYYYEECGDFEEAAVWFYNAAYETEPILVLGAAQEEPLQGLIRCYEALDMQDQVNEYRLKLQELESKK